MARTTDPEVARAIRLKRKRERQAIIYTFLITLLAIIAIMAAAILTGRIASPFDRDFSRAPVEFEELIQPCVSGPDVLPVPATHIHVSVYNASGRTGLARRTADFLVERNIDVLLVTDAPSKTQRPAIYFGIEGLDAAHTLRAHVPDVVLVLDSRAGVSLDLVLGEAFTGLRSADEVPLDGDTPLPRITGCQPAKAITPTPAPAVIIPVTPAPGESVAPEDPEDEEYPEGEFEGDETPIDDDPESE